MSYTTLYYVTPTGRIKELSKYHNSHRGAMMVWGNLYRTYLKDRIAVAKEKFGFTPEFPVDDEDYDALCKLYKNPDIPIYARAILASTFDKVVLEKECAERFHKDVLKYAGQFAAGSLIEQAEEIMRYRHNKIIGFCWNQTSVSDSVWRKGNIHETDYWFLYKELDSLCSEQQGDNHD